MTWIPLDCSKICTLFTRLQSGGGQHCWQQFADELDAFYAHFEQGVGGGIPPALPVLGVTVRMVTVTEVRSAFLRVNL